MRSGMSSLLPAVLLSLSATAMAGEPCYAEATCVIPDDTPTKVLTITTTTADGQKQVVTLNCVCIAVGKAKGAQADTGFYASGLGCGIYKAWDPIEKKRYIPDLKNMEFCGPDGLLELGCPVKP